jgi:hypothetical protein
MLREYGFVVDSLKQCILEKPANCKLILYMRQDFNLQVSKYLKYQILVGRYSQINTQGMVI